MTERYYLDASALAALALGDSSADRIVAALEPIDTPPLISDFGWGEFVAATAVRVRTQAIDPDQARGVLDTARQSLIGDDPIVLDPADVADATAMIETFSVALKLPDAIHVAITRRLGATLVSTDRQQVAAARALGIVCINPVEEVA